MKISIMKIQICLILISFFLPSAIFSQTRAKKNGNDFIPGDRIIFLDSLKSEQLGEFPSKWDLTSGTVEVMQMGEQNVIGIVNSGSKIKPLMEQESYLPNFFTIEFDVYFHNKGNEAYYVHFDNKKLSFIIRNSAIKYGGNLVRSATLKNEEGWRHVSISFNKRAFKVYLEKERLVNVPNIDQAPTNVGFEALSHSGRDDKYSMFANVRIAEGGVPLYDRLVTDGKFITNDIHFEHNEATLKEESWKIIKNVSEMMMNHESVKLRIEGHTDGDGKADYNLDLSKSRAMAVKDALVKEGVSPEKLTVEGLGESQPIASNDTCEGKAMNRRVEFILVQ